MNTGSDVVKYSSIWKDGWKKKTEGLKCIDVCRDGWMEEFKCIDHGLNFFVTGSRGWF